MEAIVCPHVGVVCNFGGNSTHNRVYIRSIEELRKFLPDEPVDLSRMTSCKKICTGSREVLQDAVAVSNEREVSNETWRKLPDSRNGTRS